MRQDTERLHQAASLLRLRRLRLQQAEQALRQAHAERLQALQAAQAGQARVDQERAARSGLLDGMTRHADLPRLAASAEACRAQRDEAVERAEVALQDDQDALAGAAQRLGQAGLALRQALARHDAAAQAWQAARRDAARHAERRAEHEVAAAAPPFSGAHR